MEVSIAEYTLQNLKGLFYLPLYLAYNFTQINSPAIREIYDKNFINNFWSYDYHCHCVFFNQYLQREQKKLEAMAMSL